MAIYDNLPAYKAAYDLLLEVYKANINLPREYRYTLGEKIKTELADLLACIYKANSNEERKEENLRCAREHIAVIKLYFRLLYDLGQISQKRFIAFAEETDALSKQLTAWLKSTIRKNKQDGELPLDNNDS
jgi:S23 ribosomal protein.